MTRSHLKRLLLGAAVALAVGGVAGYVAATTLWAAA